MEARSVATLHSLRIWAISKSYNETSASSVMSRVGGDVPASSACEGLIICL